MVFDLIPHSSPSSRHCQCKGGGCSECLITVEQLPTSLSSLNILDKLKQEDSRNKGILSLLYSTIHKVLEYYVSCDDGMENQNSDDIKDLRIIN